MKTQKTPFTDPSAPILRTVAECEDVAITGRYKALLALSGVDTASGGAAIIGVGQDRIRAALRGDPAVSLATLEAIRDCAGIPLDHLLAARQSGKDVKP